jgi:activator of 2-hydroxyglutaryl-CoA dehydratase/predicted nucleotide-binding protein (sugar kinase/HSP70/actin superfamily)
MRCVDAAGAVLSDRVVSDHGDLRAAFSAEGLAASFAGRADEDVVFTGRLAEIARDALGGGRIVEPAAAAWLAARKLATGGDGNLVFVDLSASGYIVVGVRPDGSLADDLLVVNPRCGAGSGINLDRVLSKLAVAREDVDALLADCCGDAARERRAAVPTRADRCGVFASSATVSDKNQGVPLADALAATLKSEVMKTCRKVPPGFARAVLAGRVFRWRFARDCATDHLRAQGVREFEFDTENTHVIEALGGARARSGSGTERRDRARFVRRPAPRELQSFAALRARHEAAGTYLRLTGEPPVARTAADLGSRPLLVGLDVGSTMAKAVLADAESGEVLFRASQSNAGDTIETVKRVFADLERAGVDRIRVRGIGVTGSARYQVEQALARIYPSAADRVFLLVENYAHARGSIDEARRHVERLRARGVRVNEDFCVLVDIGGEDTKVSVIALKRAELFANAMNLKCSAGTGSLMDTLAALFGIGSVAEACSRAAGAPRAWAINATCAVFLMENARKLEAQGVPRDEILASANYAIVENMARTLWGQVELPCDAVVLLHGQTMLSDPLPLAVTERLQSHAGAPMYALVPPQPGHRACLGLVRSMAQASPPGDAELRLADFLGARFEKRVIQCRGAACGDDAARCNRTSLACRGADGKRFSFTLGGCTAVNELLSKKADASGPLPRDAYKEIWDFLASRHPRTDDPRRLVVPRSFCVSEWAHLLARIFERLGVPVHVDDVTEDDVVAAHSLFHVDTCAPHIGAVGQYRRLAGQPHGMILAPQIETLPTGGASAGLTCTTNQGGVAVAANLASLAHPGARFHLFVLNLAEISAESLADQIGSRLAPVFEFYGLAPSAGELRDAAAGAVADHFRLRGQASDLAASLAEEALAEGRQVALVVGREYVLNPGVFDSSVRRLLRDKRMTAIPSYAVPVELDPAFGRVYWRNPHAVLTILSAVAGRVLHRRVTHPRLAEVFRRIEADGPAGRLLPVVQVSTFSCGPDSVSAHAVAEIMRPRPFLLLQSDAVLKELAHLENRVNTYVKQLELGLHGELRVRGGPPLRVERVGADALAATLDRERDVLYVPTLWDNRCVTSVLRAAGITCIDNWKEDHDLGDLVRSGRRHTGDSVCAPLAAVYGDLIGAVDDFVRRRERDDPLVAGRSRLLYFDNQGGGPCRQGQYADVHALLAHAMLRPADDRRGDGSPSLRDGTSFGLLVARETEAYDFGLPEWAFYRAYQGLVAQGVLHDVLFAGGAACADADEYELFLSEFRALKDEVWGALETWHGPGRAARTCLGAVNGSAAGFGVKYLAYRLHGRDLSRPISRFAQRWIRGRNPPKDALRVALTGEVYMRVAQAEDVFRALIATLGFRRFTLRVAPLWSYLEYMPIEREERALEAIRAARARPAGRAPANGSERAERAAIRSSRRFGLVLRRLVAAPLYRAAGLPLPDAPRHLLDTARELIPTLRPYGEFPLYVGEALHELRSGADVLLSVAPAGCLVTTMGEVMTPRVLRSAGRGRIQTLFSADGDVDAEILSIALLKALGPDGVRRAEAPERAVVAAS